MAPTLPSFFLYARQHKYMLLNPVVERFAAHWMNVIKDIVYTLNSK